MRERKQVFSTAAQRFRWFRCGLARVGMPPAKAGNDEADGQVGKNHFQQGKTEKL
jgi:hypothetical protein